MRKMPELQLKKIILLLLVLLFAASPAMSGDIINGRVIGIADGDTITILENKTQYKIRLYGIDCPESHQDFGARAKQFLSGMVFDKTVRVTQEDIDRYGRIVGMVYLGETCINEEIIKNGFAWVYDRYCKKPTCQTWTNLQAEAKSNGIGLWSHPDPIPPWDFRRQKKQGH